MHAEGLTAGERLSVDCALGWVEPIVGEVIDTAGEPSHDTELSLLIDHDRRPFHGDDWLPFGRGAWTRDGAVVLRDACTSGFDLSVRATEAGAAFGFRWRPPRSSKAAQLALRARFRLLARAVLVQYPALWRASVRGRAPMHAPVVRAGDAVVMLAGPSGVGKTTLIERELAAGGRAISDNLCVTDGTTAWGVVEPTRSDAIQGRRSTHGRREGPLSGRAVELVPDRVVVLRRAQTGGVRMRRLEPAEAARALVAATYMAGELRRFWGLAATLSAATGIGPVHPPIAEVASVIVRRLPCFELSIEDISSVRLAEALEGSVTVCA
jgi:hypothetical protein